MQTLQLMSYKSPQESREGVEAFQTSGNRRRRKRRRKMRMIMMRRIWTEEEG